MTRLGPAWNLVKPRVYPACRAGLTDPALAAIGEIVHDIDLKDAKFARVEASGIASVIESIAAANKDDQRRLERGAAVLDDLYELFRRKR